MPSTQTAILFSESESKLEVLTVEAFQEFYSHLNQGAVSPQDIQEMWERFKASKESLKKELADLSKAELMKLCGCRAQKSDSKAALINQAFSNLEDRFNPGDLVWSSFSEDKAQALERHIAGWTIEKITERADAIAARRNLIRKSISNPETQAEFETFILYRGAARMSLEQSARYEALRTDAQRGGRLKDKKRRMSAGVIQLPENVTLTIVEGVHTRDSYPIWVAQLNDRVEGDLFQALKIRAIKIGGSYSGFRGNGALTGFTFKDEAKAQTFIALDFVDGEERVSQKLETRKENAIAAITEQFQALRDDAEAQLAADRKENTGRRARMAANIELRARRSLQLADTMQSVVQGLEGGEVKYLDYFTTKAHFVQMEAILSRAYWDALAAEKKDGRISPNDYREKSEGDIAHARFPYPRLQVEDVARLAMVIGSISGLKLIAARLLKIVEKAKGSFVLFKGSKAIEDLRKILIKRRLLHRVSIGSLDHIESQLAAYDRLQRMNVCDGVELRTALREYWEHRGAQLQADPIRALIRELVNFRFKDYHPTPDGIADEMVDWLDIKPGDRVCDGSAGTGHLADAVARAIPLSEITLTLIELQPRLAEVLEAKGYESSCDDFLNYTGAFDKGIFNPPFSGGQDMVHCQHAYKLLAPGGTLILIMGHGAFFRTDRQSCDFRNWLHSVGGRTEKLPSGSFQDSDRPTGVACQLVYLTKAVAD